MDPASSQMRASALRGHPGLGSWLGRGHGTWNAPTLEFSTATGILGTPGHSWQFAAQSGMSIGHKSLLFATRTMAVSILDLMTRPELLKEARSEFEEHTEGREYRSPLPPDLKPPLHQLEA